jgi:hypothetical protein
VSQWAPDKDVVAAQRAVCEKYGTPHQPPRYDRKVGVNLTGDRYPLNGLREPEDDRWDEVSGWWIWSGERSIPQDDSGSFFDSLHAWHLPERCPEVLPYLGLPPGWRFLIAPGYEDVWFDQSLLER